MVKISDVIIHMKYNNTEEQVKAVNEAYNKALKLLKDLCAHYGIKNNVALQAMEVPSNYLDEDALKEYYKQYVNMQKNNINKINAEIDRIQESRQQKTLEDYIQKMK